MSKPELCTMLILSTAHLQEDMIQEGYDLGGYGCLMYVSDQDDWREEVTSECPALKGPFELAAALGASWIKFDPDGPVMDDLPVYEWEG
jgi:hypothetical protein